MQDVRLDNDRGARWRERTAAKGGRLLELALLQAVLLSAGASVAQAQERVVAFPTHSAAAGSNADVDRALRAALQARSGVELAPAPALDLEALQLAIDCVGTNAECLREVAKRSNGEVVIAPSIERKGEGTELRLLYFSARAGESRFAARREASKRIGAETLKAIPSMLDELFAGAKAEPEAAELPAPEAEAEPQSAPVEPAAAAVDSAPEPASSRRLPIAPLLVAGGGVVVVGIGLVMGGLMRDTERKYTRQPVTTVEEAEAANELRQRGKSEALIANVMLTVGGAAIAAGGVWLVLKLTGDHDQPETAVIPDLGPDHAGLQVAGRWGAL